MPKKRTLTTGAIAKHCEVNLRTVLRWIENGHLKAYRLPGRGDNRVEISDFINFLNAHHMPVPEELKQFTKRVLVVDDDPTTCAMLESLLQKEDYETKVASNGFQAGLYLESFEPSLITLDLSMPGVDGYQVISWVKGSEDFKTIKILVISGGEQADLDKALEAGADGVLPKPIASKTLSEKILALTTG